MKTSDTHQGFMNLAFLVIQHSSFAIKYTEQYLISIWY